MRPTRLLLMPALLAAGAAMAQPQLVLNPDASNIPNAERITWNVVGLDDKPATAGPNRYLVGVRVKNIGDVTATNVTATYVWDEANANINLTPGSPSVLVEPAVLPGEHIDFYFDVTLTRLASVIDQSRDYHIEVTADTLGTVTTPIGEELYVEKLIKQNRNSTNTIVGPTTVFVGGTFDYRLESSTATNGYEQLVTTIDFPNTLFQIRNIDTTYTAPTGATNDKIYVDACGWINDPASISYFATNQNQSCNGIGQYEASGSKAGGDVVTDYKILITDISASDVSVFSIIYDFSGASYHYNSDFATGGTSITITTLNPSMGGRVFVDNNADLIYQVPTPESDTPLPGVPVKYYTAGPNGLFGDGDDVLEGTTSTDGDGVYGFYDIPDGVYQVRIDRSVGVPGSYFQVSGKTIYDVTLPVPTSRKKGDRPSISSRAEPNGVFNLDAGFNSDPLFVSLGDTYVENLKDRNEFMLIWETDMEVSNAGFHVYRAVTKGGRDLMVGERLTKTLIPSESTFGEGAQYFFVDPVSADNEFISRAYYLEDLEYSGRKTIHGPFFQESVTAGRPATSGLNDWTQFAE